VGTMNGFVASCRPAGAGAQTRAVILSANDNAAASVLLEMALKAEIGVPSDQHFVVHRAVRVMAGGASFAEGFVLENKWAALRNVTSEE
jgi:hypothetical protein